MLPKRKLLTDDISHDIQCERCHKDLPLHKFPEAEKGKFVCIDCENTTPTMRDRRDKKARKMQESFKQLVAATSGKKINSPHVSELAAGLTGELGGLDEVCRRWANQIKVLEQTHPGSKILMDAYAGWAKMVVESTKNRESAPDVVDMDDEELVSALIHTVTEWNETTMEGVVLSIAEEDEDDRTRETA